MAKVLLITQRDLKDFTSANGNIDPDKLMPFINVAQDLEMERLLGTALIDKISDDITNSTLTGQYQTLVETYIKPTLCWYAMTHLIPFHAYNVSNTGMYKHQSESSITPEKSEVDAIKNNCEAKAQNYADRMINYLCDYSSDFPEYSQKEKGGIWADKESQAFGGINLDGVDIYEQKVITLRGESRKH